MIPRLSRPAAPRIRALITLLVVAPLLSLRLAATPPAVPRTLLFIDDEHVYYRPGTARRVVEFTKFTGNPVIAPNRPWESEAIGWCSQLRHPVTGKYQMWYQAYTQRNGDRRLKSVVCYAESDDARSWTKPALGQFAFYEEKDTNIVLIGSGGYGDRYCNSVIWDAVEPDPARRYKMLYSDWATGPDERKGPGLYAAFSPDGIRWTKAPEPLLPFFAGAKGAQAPYVGEDVYAEQPTAKGVRRSWRWPLSMSDAVDLIYDTRLGVYVIYGKMWFPGPDGKLGWKHGMGRSESRDFKSWSIPTLLLTTDEYDLPNEEFHTSPVFPYGDLYLSLNQRMNRDAGTIDLELMSSRDGLRWDRSLRRQVIVPRGTGAVFDASALASNASPLVVGDELRFYYGAYRYSMTGGIARWASRQVIGSTDYVSGVGYASTLRDRFVALVPDARIPVKATRAAPAPANTLAQVTLRPLDLSAVTRLTLNADASQGAVRVEILDEQGYRLRGFTHDDALPLTANGLNQVATWKTKSLRDLPPGRHLIRIHLDRAELFALTLH
ncbi:MAG: hypothetical protein JNN01_13555 [Opitutaceae bacterium]|nr:hypothetical protein [Opitutaceae bacterium]